MAVVGCVLIFFTRPVYGLVVYIAVLVWYPSYLAVEVASFDITASRVITLAIFAKLFLGTNLPQYFRWIWLDKLIILCFVAEIATGATNGSLSDLIKNRIGAVFDMAIPYFAVRLILVSKEEYLRLLKGILLISVPFAVLTCYQCLTGANPFDFLREYNARIRNGFFRPELTFSDSIMLGMFFAMFGPVCAGLLRNVQNNKLFYQAGIAFMIIGAISSVSSGPILVIILAVVFIVCYRWRRYWRTAMLVTVVMCGCVEIISNRHFYDVLGGYTMSPETAWYRSKLIDVAIFEGGMSGHWLTGFGLVDPGWSFQIDNRSQTDMVNHYLLVLCRYGLVGFIPFMSVVIVAVREIVRAFKASMSEPDRCMIWSLAGAFFGILIGLFSVSLFGPPKTILYLLFGFCGAMPRIVSETNVKILAALQHNPGFVNILQKYPALRSYRRYPVSPVK